MIRRFAAAAVLAEDMEAKLAAGAEIDISEHALLCSSLVRIGNKIGIDRVAKQVRNLDTVLLELAKAKGPAEAKEPA